MSQRQTGLGNATDAQKGGFAAKDMRNLRAAVCVAQEMGARLG